MTLISKTRMVTAAVAATIFAALVGSAARVEPPTVTVMRVPDSGMQPQVITRDGVLHLVYFIGDPEKGDLNYVNSRDYGRTFSKPIRVNSEPGTALAVGNMRGGQIAIGRNGRVHVAWIGSSAALPRRGSNSSPVLYARMNDAGTGFDPSRVVNQQSWGADGASLAADSRDNVFVFWHAQQPQGKNEESRRLWMAKSLDGGKTFAGERVAFGETTGVCGCCGSRAFADAAGSLYVLFRAATQMVHRDIYLLSSTDHGATFKGADISPWNIGACVMSSASLVQSADGILAAWETEKQVYFGRVAQGTNELATSVGATGTGVNRKYPALAVNSRGEVLLAWTEGMAWKKGGAAAWQVYDKDLKPEVAAGKSDGVPVWGLVAAFARPDGSFAVVY
ncbi:MAG TPA: sialidase family protein [Chthoniobacterales bacterium]|jgi:hypothetical protein